MDTFTWTSVALALVAQAGAVAIAYIRARYKVTDEQAAGGEPPMAKSGSASSVQASPPASGETSASYP